MATSLLVVRCLRCPNLLCLVGLLLTSWPCLAGDSLLRQNRPPRPSAYYQRVFSDFTRESPCLLVRVSWHGQRRELVLPNAEFARLLAQQYHLSESAYIAFLASRPVVANVVLVDRPLVLPDARVLVKPYPGAGHLAQQATGSFLRRYTHLVGSTRLLNGSLDARTERWVLKACIQRRYWVRTDDETGYYWLQAADATPIVTGCGP